MSARATARSVCGPLGNADADQTVSDTAPAIVWIWWGQPRTTDQSVLTAAERTRWSRYLQPAVRDRFACGVRLQRQALRELTGVDVALDRYCPSCQSAAHGPTSPSHPYELRYTMSVSHSENRIVVAVRAGVAPVGVDIEVIRPRHRRFAEAFLSARETRAHLLCADPAASLARRWVRKEAVLKLTREGLTGSMTDLDVGDINETTVCLVWHGLSLRLADLDLGAGYAGCVAAATDSPLAIHYMNTAISIDG